MRNFLLRIFLPLVLLTVLAYPALKDIFRPGYFTSHDGEGHIIRMQEFYQAFADDMFPVRWSKRLYYGFGYPFFNFNYPLVYYAGLPPMLLGYSATTAMEVELVLTFVVSGWLMYLYLRRKVSVPFALAGAVLYMYAPYRLLNIYVRGSVAEAAAFIFAPAILWVVEAIAAKQKLAIPLGAIIIALLGLSHNISALLFFAFYWIYVLFQSLAKKDWRVIWRSGLSFALGIVMALFFLVPALYEKQYTFLDVTIAKDYPAHFVYPVQLIKGGWDFGASIAGPDDGLSFNLGWVALVLALPAIGWGLLQGKILQKARLQSLFLYTVFMLAVSLFFMFEWSKIFWDHLPLLPFVQFPWRFIILIVPVLTVLAVLTLEMAKRQWRWAARQQWLVATLVIAACFWQARPQWHLNQVLVWDDPQTQALPGTTTWADEQATQWLTPRPKAVPEQRVEIAGNNTPVQITEWKTQLHRYNFSATDSAKVVEHTMYYPGWRVWVDGQEVELNYQDQDYPGRLVYSVQAGEHQAESKLTETPLRKAVNYLSLAAWLFVAGWLLRSLVRPEKK